MFLAADAIYSLCEKKIVPIAQYVVHVTVCFPT